MCFVTYWKYVQNTHYIWPSNYISQNRIQKHTMPHTLNKINTGILKSCCGVDYNWLSTLFLKQTGDEWILDTAWELYQVCSGDPLSLLYFSYNEITDLIHCFLYVLCTVCQKLMHNGEDIFPCFHSRATVWIWMKFDNEELMLKVVRCINFGL